MRAKILVKLGRERGMTMLTFAILAPIFFALTFLAISLFYHFRIVSVVNHAAEVGAAMATSTEISQGLSNKSGGDWQQYLHIKNSNTSSSVTSNYFIWDKCLGKSGEEATTCMKGSGGLWDLLQGTVPSTSTSPYSPNSITTPILKIWNGYLPSDSEGNLPLNLTEQLPWKLYDSALTSNNYEYNKVQYLPRVCIKAGCVESFNESETSLGITLAGSGVCTRPQSLCWSIDERLDFDGDGKEDIVLFRPTGKLDLQDSGGGDFSEIDWIVYHSGAGYTGPVTGHGYFNLGTEGPSSSGGGVGSGTFANISRADDIPIPADYDRDGLADYAVFQPSSGKIKIAFSSREYSIIWDYFLGSEFTDATGYAGFVAIPGSYGNPLLTPSSPVRYEDRRIGVAIFRTAAVNISPTDRYEVRVIIPPDVATVLAGLPATSSVDHGTPYTIPVTVPDPIIKPRPGMSAVPAFADYDKDGETEIGWVSWSAGNPTRHIGGQLYGTNSFETNDGPANDLRMNPFDIAVSPDNRYTQLFYYLDAVQGTIWKLTNPTAGEAPFLGATGDENVVRVVNTIASALSFPGADFPIHNVMNIPAGVAMTLPSGDAGNYKLNSPRRMVAGPDGALYVADWGNNSIVRFGRTVGPSTIVPTSAAARILSAPKLPVPCPAGCHDTLPGPAGPTVIGASSFGNLSSFNPIAVAIVPDPSSTTRYHLAFSDGNAVFLLRNDGAGANGPDGSAGEIVVWIGGRAPATGGVPTTAVRDLLWASVSGKDPNAQICPITDLAYDYSNASPTLYGTSSCNTAQRPGELVDAVTLPNNNHPVAGGIIKFENILAGDPAGTKLSLVAGNFWTENEACASSSLSFPLASKAGTPATVCQRKINITPRGSVLVWNHDASAPLKYNDIFNPVSLVVDPDGNILFINQWNEIGGRAVASIKLSNNFTHGIYRVNRHTKDIEPLTNPFSYGAYSIPIESGMWFSPNSRLHSTNAWEQMWVPPFKDAPIKNVPFPAVAAIEMSANKKYLYSATPYLPADNWYTPPSAHAISVDQSKVGFIFGVFLDTDGDTISDFIKTSADSWSSPGGFNDADVDGDSAIGGPANVEGSYRSAFVAEIAPNSADFSARVTERAGLPVQYFARWDGGSIAVPNSGANGELFGQAAKNIVEFPFINQLSSVGVNDSNEVQGLRPEPWSLLFDAVLDSTSTTDSAGIVFAPQNKDGPIAVPLPLHGIVGLGKCGPAPGCQIGNQIGSYPDNSQPQSADANEFNQFLFPLVLGSGSRLEVMRPVKRGKPPLAYPTIGNWSYTKSGVLCYDYKDTTLSSNKQPFGSSLARDGLGTGMMMLPKSGASYPVPLSFNETDDMVWYLRNCPITGDPSPSTMPIAIDFSSSATKIITEPIVLGLDHDHDDFSSERDASVTDGNGTNWPADWISGGKDEFAHRAVVFIDHDGDNLRNPTFYGQPVLFPPSTGSQSEAFVVGTGGLLTKTTITPLSSPNWNQSLTALEIQRHPFSDRSAGERFPLNESNTPDSVTRIADTFRFMSEFGTSTPVQYPNTLFDPGWKNSSYSGNSARSDGFVIALDREAIIPDVVTGVGTTIGDLGADLLENSSSSNISLSNRFLWPEIDGMGGLPPLFLGCQKTYPPGLVPMASMAVLMDAVPVAMDHCKFGSLSEAQSVDLEPWAYVTMLPDGCQGALPQKECTGIEVGYTHMVMGKVQKISRNIEFNLKLGQVN